MIVWVFFQPGVGGDGVANLLEHSSNAVSLDGKVTWRIHRYVNSKVKFWAPNLFGDSTRTTIINQLTTEQLKIAKSNDKYFVIASHDIEFMKVFQNNSIPEENNIKLLVIHDNFIEQQVNCKTKNLIEFDLSKINQSQSKTFKHSSPDFLLDIKSIQNWEYTKKIVDKIGLTLSQSDFEHYKTIVSGELMYDTAGIEYYKSYVDKDNITKYIKIN